MFFAFIYILRIRKPDARNEGGECDSPPYDPPSRRLLPANGVIFLFSAYIILFLLDQIQVRLGLHGQKLIRKHVNDFFRNSHLLLPR